ncbi:PNK3P-domain-containing protein [Meira miltonrushii]|uniref:PNK3P-domain-containing protein n=1 Tax=Meira miltonrushii TaxID=1280837 RepID=A0A316VEV7_9BASI|nr:PNK3P-domain-containing protein [Meira miltonrushii]PWN36070.1 PNK3P-domain-containing protein [Meira miltonrushii]
MTKDAGKMTESKGNGYRVLASAKRTPSSEVKKDPKRTKMEGQSSPSAQLAPIFRRRDDAAASSSASPSALKWKKPLGAQGTCLYAEYGNPFERELESRQKNGKVGKVKVACFDLDGCLIKPKGGKTWPSATDVFDYEQAFKGTFERVKQEYESGSCIAIITNQSQSDPKSKRLQTWKVKIANIARVIDCPMIIFAAIAKDGFRKPGRLMWDHGIVQSYVEAGGNAKDIDVDPSIPFTEQISFFVGDAAGRVGDHADTDRKWATNVGISFYTPEEYFLSEKPKAYKLTGWRPVLPDANDEKGTLPSNFFTQSMSSDKLDLVLFVGPPAAGKTSFYRQHFADRDYVWVNQDTLKTAAKCQNEVRNSLKAGRSVVVDNTNRNVTTRSHYIQIAQELGNVQVRCVFFDVSEELCWHNNLFRVRAGLQPINEPRQLLPKLAISSYYKGLEIPKKEEGFDADVVVVEWAFRGGQEAKQRWLKQWE